MTTATSAESYRSAIAPAMRQPARRRWLLGALFAGLLLVGLIQTAVLIADDDSPILRMNDRHLVAAGALESVLHDGFTAQVRTGPQVGDRFRNPAGDECRRFAGRPAVEGPIAGVACMIEGDWRIVELRQDSVPVRQQ